MPMVAGYLRTLWAACFSDLPSDRNDFAILNNNSTHLCLLFAVAKEAIDCLRTALKCTFGGRKIDLISLEDEVDGWSTIEEDEEGRNESRVASRLEL